MRDLARAGAIVFVASAIAACNGREPRQEKADSMTNVLASTAVCIGRFEFAVPPDVRVDGRNQSIYAVSVSAEPLPAEGFEELWTREVDAARAAGRLERTSDLEGGAKGLWRKEGESGVKLEAVRQFGDHAFFASAAADAGREAVLQKLVGNVLAAYRPNERAGFCLERGVIVSEPSRGESTGLVMKHLSIAGFTIEFETQTVKEPLAEERLSDASEIEGAMPPASVKRLSRGNRSVAGIDGVEERLAVSPGQEPPFVRFSWKSPGASLKADLPQITIIGVAPLEHQSQLGASWDAVLNSTRKVPMAR